MFERLGEIKHYCLESGPWLFGDFVIVTDGILFVAVPKSSIAGDYKPPPDSIAKNVAPLLGGASEHSLTTSVEHLREFVGAARVPCVPCKDAGSIDCTFCEGEGWFTHSECRCGVDHDVDCPHCDGDGSQPCPVCKDQPRANPGRILEHVVDRFAMVRLFDAVQPSGELKLFTVEARKGFKVLAIDGEGWRAIVAPLDPRRWADKPVDAVFEPGVAA